MPKEFFQIARYILPAIALLVLFYCSFSIMKKKPAPPTTAAHLNNNANGDIISLSNWENSVGRSKSCDIVLNYPTVSRFHAVLALRTEGWIVADTLSRTGVFVNGKRVKKKSLLEHGDIVAFGGAAFAFELDKLKKDENIPHPQIDHSEDIYFNKKQN